MTNKFTTPCFVRVEDAEERGKLSEWLKGLGYILFKCDGPVIYCIDDYFQAVATSHPSYPNKLGIGCGYNIELFKALAAMNSENDREQWFATIMAHGRNSAEIYPHAICSRTDTRQLSKN